MRRVTWTAGAIATLLCALVFATTPTRAQEFEGNYGVGIPEVFLPKYLAFRTGQLASGSPDVMRIKLGYVKGLSRSFAAMVGEAAINPDWRPKQARRIPGRWRLDHLGDVLQRPACSPMVTLKVRDTADVVVMNVRRQGDIE